MFNRKKIILYCLALPALLLAQSPEPVQVQLLASVERLAPGQPFLLGVRLRMEEGWHTYWEFSGDAGLPTSVEWHLPPGFQAGPLQWPTPHKYTEEGGLTVYGYQDETLLMAQVQPPPALHPDSLQTLQAKVSWLVCREVCIPGDTTLALRLPVGPAKPAHQALFARYQAQVPVYLDADGPLRWGAAVRRTGAGVQVDLELKGRNARIQVGPDAPDFYPLPDGQYEFSPPQRLLAEADQPASEGSLLEAVRLRALLKPYEQRDIRLRGLLVYRLEGETHLRHGILETGLEAGPEHRGGLLSMDFKSAAGEQQSFLAYVLLAALGGLLLNLMPCVLPVISLKILSLVSQSGAQHCRVRSLGLAFAAGVTAAFVGLAVVVIALRAGGEQLGWGFQFQSPGFVMAMTCLVFALGLSLFGMFTVQLPGLSDLGGTGQGEGLTGSFCNGVLATVLATPCTAPFLGTALGFAFAQPAAVVLGIFLASGAGMALPYLALALEPRWSRFLPRPGAWMERFKQFMGFLLMGTALWLLWVLGKQLGMEAVIWTGAFLLALALACWIVGQWIDLNSSTRRRRLAWGVAALLVVGAYRLFLYPLLEGERQVAATPQHETLAWQEFSLERVEHLLEAGRPVFIDFTAEWCWTCKVNERTVLASDRVRRKLAELDVALVKADWTSRNPQITALLRAFGRSGVPLYVIFPAGRADHPLVLPEVITPELVIEKLDEAAALGQPPGA